MLFKDRVHSPKGDIFSFYFFYFLFVLNNKTFNSKKVESFFWDLAKCELFYCAGYCKHTGNCCQNMLFMKKGIWFDSKDKFNKLKAESPMYDRFKPVSVNTGYGCGEDKIRYYSCSHLSKDGYCIDHESRPLFCRNYPMSNFLLYDYVPRHCGYRILRKNISPTFGNKAFLALFDNVVRLNHLA
jgi:Fe-S-cluster containining protein